MTTPPASVVTKVGQRNIDALKEYWTRINPIIATESAKSRVGANPMAASSVVTPTVRYSGPHGYYQSHWWGDEFGVDGYLVNKLATGAAGTAAVMAGLGVGAPLAVLLVAAGAILKVCQHSDGWSILYFVFGVWGCNPF